MIFLKQITHTDRELFYNINQKYLYEMTMYYPDKMDDEGNLHYGHFDEYFTDLSRRAFFIYNDENMVGFAMINPYSLIGHSPDYTMAEFTIFPMYRRRNFASCAVKLIFDMFPGKWEIKFNEKNTAAKKFWTKHTALYNPVFISINDMETIIEFNNNK